MRLKIVSIADAEPRFAGMYFLTVTDGKQTTALAVPEIIWRKCKPGDVLEINLEKNEFVLGDMHVPTRVDNPRTASR